MSDLGPFLQPTRFLDADHPALKAFVEDAVDGAGDDRRRAVGLYRRVRDDIRYEPYRISLAPENMTASATLARGEGFCVSKAVLLAAVGRAAGIPSRLGFADVRNHLATRKLLDILGSDLFIWHGYTELYVGGRWLKATPAFDLALCERFGVLPLEFDGTDHSTFHPYDRAGRLHMEYVRDHGAFADLPLETLEREYRAFYPNWGHTIAGDFGTDAGTETAGSGGARTGPGAGRS